MSNPAELYENKYVPALFGPAAELLVKAAAPRPGDRVLDAACGTGIVLRTVVPHVGADGTLTGIDNSPDMLTVARDIAQREGLDAAFHETPAEDLPFADGSFDLVLCGLGLMYFTDRPAALAEMGRVLADGGRVALTVWQDISRQHVIHETFLRSAAEQLGISDYRELPNPFSLGDPDGLHTLLADAGFDGIELEPLEMTAWFPNPAGWLEESVQVSTAAIPAFRELDEAAQQRVVEAVKAEADPMVKELTIDDQLALPMHPQIVHATCP